MLHSKNTNLKTWVTSGELWIWLNAAAVGISITAVGGLLGLIAVRGLAHFWPADVAAIHYESASGVAAYALGEVVETESLLLDQYRSATGDTDDFPADVEVIERSLIKTGNRRVDPPDFQWIYSHRIASIGYPDEAAVFERMEWGNAYGVLEKVLFDGSVVAEADTAWTEFHMRLERVETLREAIARIERGEFNTINYALEQIRIERRRLELDTTLTDAARERSEAALRSQTDALTVRYTLAETDLAALIEDLQRDAIEITISTGATLTIPFADVVRGWQPNRMSVIAKLKHYFFSVWLFLTDDPREANTEGGILPAIFGTVLMVLLMSVLVTPLGVVAAVYLREYARQGAFVQLIRIAVNNLAGVPSIVYGVFGLGFFVYFLGGNLDALFFEAALPAPTFGTPGLVWASLTLALLTVPVVIVSTEEGLTRIPRSIREGSLALGATKAETLFKVVLPVASPSIFTGVILAVARAAGEVAPLMLVGVVKLAPTLPLDGNFPYLHLERKFMHLGFHIYDVGFQSPNVDAARPLVYATALLLVLLIVGLNLTAIMLRTRLEDRYRGVES
ncbi:MAG: phosphate ABC transporter permease PstA [Proteobacteria bacterium]|nr:phosphate ABC transporter permease PstA [Pseudomonadota bacterium]